eukprot:1821159-Rhodomonas_salina.1
MLTPTPPSSGPPAPPPMPSDRVFSVDEDLEIFNLFPFPVSVCDYHPDRQGFLWGNKATLEIFGKKDLDDLRAWDFYKVSDGVKRMHDDYYHTVQVNLNKHGPTRRTMHPASGTIRVDFTLVPITITQKHRPTPRIGAMLFMIPVADEVEAEAVCGHYMVERSPSMAMLFLRGEGRLIQQNTLARAHCRKVTGRAGGEVSLDEVVDAFVWEDEEEEQRTLQKLKDLDLGEGAVVFERMARMPQADDETTQE